ncbi:SDR family oxidoreductase [Rhodoligotrophos ferricapiens]|uniref:SDR family oxidoreductase n=1 Tax=Rhodoligotrophos ferricapiens TaxID=3069264 RepID=UPI00315DF1B7
MSTQRKTIVLTGASRGLGLALARELVRLGHHVEACSRSGQASEPVDYRIAALDVSNPGQLNRWAAGIIEAGRTPDILICNAAVINAPAPLWQVPQSELSEVIGINLLGTGYTIQAFAPAMIKRGSGIIVTLSSGWGRSTDPEMAPYCASRWAVEGMTLSLAQELPNGMAAVTLSPGVVNTKMLHKCWPEHADAYETPEPWAKRAAPYILAITSAHNGSQLTVPAP